MIPWTLIIVGALCGTVGIIGLLALLLLPIADRFEIVFDKDKEVISARTDNTVKKIVRSEKRKLTRDFIILVFAGVLMFFAGIYLGYAAKGTGFWPYRKLFPAEAAKQEAQLERERYFDKLNADGQFVAEDGKTYTYYVIIDGEEISFCGQKYADTAALRAELEKVKRANTVMVFDDFAVSSIYHDVTELLSELGIDYEETR